MDQHEVNEKMTFISEKKKFIAVREGHGEWFDGELLRGISDAIFLGIRQITQEHIEGFRHLGQSFKDFGRKLGYKGLPIIVFGDSILLNVNIYKTRITHLDAKRTMWSGQVRENDFDWKAVSMCEQKGGMNLEAVMQRVIWITREQKILDADCDEKDTLIDRMRFTHDSFKKTLNRELSEEDKRALFYYYTCEGIHESKRNNMLLQHLVEDPQMTLKYLFLDDGKGNILIDGLLKCILNQRNKFKSQNREFLMKKIVEFLANKSFDTKY